VLGPVVHEKDPFAGLKTAPGGRGPVEYVMPSPSGSVAFIVNVSAEFSLTDFEFMGSKTGGLLISTSGAVNVG